MAKANSRLEPKVASDLDDQLPEPPPSCSFAYEMSEFISETLEALLVRGHSPSLSDA